MFINMELFALFAYLAAITAGAALPAPAPEPRSKSKSTFFSTPSLLS
jgi:hypothetical protein